MMKTRQILAGLGLILAVLTFWVNIPLVVPVLFIGAAVVVD